MTRATLCALLAGVVAAGALADLATRRPRSTGPGGARPSRWRQQPSGGDGSPATVIGRDGGRLARLVAVLVTLGRRLGAAAGPGDLADRVAAAGAPLGLSAADLRGMKGAAALVGGLAGVPLAAAAPGRLGLVVLLAAPGAGFLAPDAWLRRRARVRAGAMATELPDVLDLLRVAVEAGLPVGRAIAEVGRRHRGVLAAELRAAAAAVELGTPRAAALAALQRRAPLPAVGALTAAVERAERYGAPLSPALTAIAAQARADAARELAERAARAAPKIQLAVALLLVPAVLLLVAAGAVAALLPH